MRGKPKYLNTKQDYLNLLNMTEAQGVTKADKEEALKELLDNREDWFFDKVTSENEGINDATHKVIINEDVDGAKTYAQYILKKNDGATIYRLGFTIEEVNALLANL